MSTAQVSFTPRSNVDSVPPNIYGNCKNIKFVKAPYKYILNNFNLNLFCYIHYNFKIGHQLMISERNFLIKNKMKNYKKKM